MVSFYDLISSSRGPGVIGTLVALLVLVGFTSLTFFAFDEGMQGSNRSIESVIRDQAKELEYLQNSITEANEKLKLEPERKRISSEVANLASSTRINSGKVSGSAKIAARITSDISVLEREFDNYRLGYRKQVRSQAVGLTYPELRLLSGKAYNRVCITRVDAVGIAFTHENGSTRAEFSDLPMSMQAYFQFDAKEQVAAKAAEAVVANQHSDEVDTALLNEDRKKSDEEQRKSEMLLQQAQNAQSAMTLKIADLDKQIVEVNEEWGKQRQRVQQFGGVLDSASFRSRIGRLQEARASALEVLRKANAVIAP